MNRLSLVTLTGQDISSPLLLATYTADADRELLLQVYLSGLAGNTSYKATVTKKLIGAGPAYQAPTSAIAVADTVTTAFFPSIAIPVKNTDVVKIYVQGGITDTTVSVQVEVWDVTAGTSSLDAAGVWDEAIAGHLSAGSTGAALNTAGTAGDPWAMALPAAYGAGTAGYIVGNELDAKVSSRSTLAQSDILSDATPFAGADIDAKISSRSTLAQSDILSDAMPFAGGDIDAKITSRSTFAGGAVASVTGNVGGNVNGNVVGSVASVAGNIGGNVVGTVASVAGNVSGNVTGSVGSVLANVSLSGTTEIAIANAVAALTRDGYTWSEILGIMGAAVAGKVSGSPVNPVFRALDDSADRISAVTTVAGDRTAITLTP